MHIAGAACLRLGAQRSAGAEECCSEDRSVLEEISACAVHLLAPPAELKALVCCCLFPLMTANLCAYG
jgi:hypothetical protein